MPPPPSGQQFVIAHGEMEATVVEVGGGLRRLSAGGRELLDGYAEDRMCRAGRGQILVPWPNRIADGRYAWDGQDLQLPLTEPPTRCAIHGLARWANWRVVRHEPDRVVMGLRLHPQPGYPFTLELEVEHRLDAEGLSVRTTAVNAGDAPCPYGAGAHPYLVVGTPTIDTVEVEAPGRVRLVADERGIPIGRAPVAGTPFDFVRPRVMGDTVLDTAFTDLARDADGRAWVRLRAPDGTAVALWMDAAHPHLMLFTGDPQPTVARRSLGVEPMTCAPNAFASGDGVRTLAPGEAFTAVWGVQAP